METKSQRTNYGVLFPHAPGGEQPTRPRSITVISYALFASAGLQIFGLITMIDDPAAIRAAAQSGLLPAPATYSFWLISTLIGISCGYLVRIGNNNARLLAMAWFLFGALINSIAAALMSFPGSMALVELFRWVFVGTGIYFLTTPKALAFFADRGEA